MSIESPRVGDLDGDGFDDFVLSASGNISDTGQQGRPLLYLFYGREEFPQQLSTADADASFEVDVTFNGAVGDVNGDGLSDLLFSHYGSSDLVFGSKQRFSGFVPYQSAGVSLTVGTLPPPFVPGGLIHFEVRPAGDVNGDGCDDLITSVNAIVSPTETADQGWLTFGHTGPWQSGLWDGSAAASDLGQDVTSITVVHQEVTSLGAADPAGDLDGDGLDDLIAHAGTDSAVLYGRREYPAALSIADVDARLVPTPDPLRSPEQAEDPSTRPVLFASRLGDLDADGSDDLAVHSDDLAVDSAESEIPNEFQIMYGQHWSGQSEVKPELHIFVESPGDQSIVSAAAGDLDGDSFPDLVLAVVGGFSTAESVVPTVPVGLVYVLRGTGQRLSGNIQLSARDRWNSPVQLPGVNSAAGQSIFNVALVGDIDGDGSQDILTIVMPRDPSDGWQPNAVYLVPSTPHGPD